MPRYNQPRKTWQYTTDFKIKAVKLSFQDGIRVKQVAEGLDYPAENQGLEGNHRMTKTPGSARK